MEIAIKIELRGDKCSLASLKLSQVQSGSVANSFETCIVTNGGQPQSKIKPPKKGKWERLHLEARDCVIDSTRTLSIPPTLSLSATWTSWLHNRRDKRNPSECMWNACARNFHVGFLLYLLGKHRPIGIAVRDTLGRGLSRLDMLFPWGYTVRVYRHVSSSSLSLSHPLSKATCNMFELIFCRNETEPQRNTSTFIYASLIQIYFIFMFLKRYDTLLSWHLKSYKKKIIWFIIVYL